MPMGGPMSVGGICVVLVVLVDVLRFFLGFPPDCDPDGTRKLPPTILLELDLVTLMNLVTPDH